MAPLIFTSFHKQSEQQRTEQAPSVAYRDVTKQ